MRTYHLFQPTILIKCLLTLLLCLPLGLTAADDCRDLLRDAKDIAKDVENAKEAAREAETDLLEAEEARNKAKAALKAFENPVDEGKHGADVPKERKRLQAALEKAEEKVLEAKADYYDALQELIDQLQALRDKLDAADTQCDNELEAAERERVRNKLKDYQDELDDLRDRHNLEEREGEAEEPQNTQKKQDELVETELKALLEEILKALKEKHPDPEDFRSALREKLREIRNDWDNDFWDTPLGKRLKEQLEKALRAAMNAPAGESAPEETTPETEEKTQEESSFRSESPRQDHYFALGLSLGITDHTIGSWCPAPADADLAQADLVSVITASDPTIHTTGQTGLSAETAPGNTFPSDRTAEENVQACLKEWVTQPRSGLFFNIGLGDQWAATVGAFRQSARALPATVVKEFVREDGTIQPATTSLSGTLERLEFQAGLLRYFGSQGIRPVVGLQAVYQYDQMTAVLDQEHRAPQNFSRKSNRWGAQAMAGIQLRVFRYLDLGITGQWDQYFTADNAASGAGFQLQFIWHP